MQTTEAESVAAELHAVVGDAISDCEFSDLVERVVAYRLLDGAGFAFVE